jgi:hypothetical protein
MFYWLDYLDLARRLANDLEEASQRSSISRAYYAAFHTAKRHIEELHPEIRIPSK